MRKTMPDLPATVFDRTDTYKTEIEPIITELIKACSSHGLPMFVSVCTANDKNGTHYENRAVTADTRNINLTDDYFTKFVSVTLGFELIRPEDIDTQPIETETEDLNIVQYSPLDI